MSFQKQSISLKPEEENPTKPKTGDGTAGGSNEGGEGKIKH
jgi:hypothetical protein